MTDGDLLARRLVAIGRVQGVFFRSMTHDLARRHGVAGWVRNLPNGTVEAWLEGPSEAVERVAGWIRSGGPPAAEVEQVEEDVREPAGHRRFEIR